MAAGDPTLQQGAYGLPPKNAPAGQPTRQQAAQQFVQQNVPAGYQGLIKHPVAFVKNALRGAGPATHRLAYLQAVTNAGGYGDAQKALTDKYTAELNNPTVNYQHQMDPTLGRMSSYLNARLGVGLTPEETAAIRGRGIEQTEGSAATASRDTGQRLAAAGIDPRSGLAAAQYGGIERQREAGRAGVERDITQADLERKQQIEQEAAQQAALEESARQFDVGAGLRRQGMVETGLGALADMGEKQREYNLDYSESQRQAAKSRKAWDAAGRALQPSTLEKWAGGISGLLSGLGG